MKLVVNTQQSLENILFVSVKLLIYFVRDLRRAYYLQPMFTTNSQNNFTTKLQRYVRHSVLTSDVFWLKYYPEF